MSKYSFLLATKEVEYCELTPVLRLKKLGNWLVSEAIEQEEIAKSQSQATIRAVQLAKKIAAAKDIPLDEAFSLLQNGGDLSESDLLSDYTEETLSMISSGTSVETGNAKIVTAFMRTRGEALIDDEWQALEDWSMDDTKSMGRLLINKVIQFVNDEQDQETKEAAKAKKEQTKKTSVSQGD